MKKEVENDDKITGFEYDLMNELNTVASATECTGLIQIPPADEAEAAAYCDIYVIPKQVNDFEKVKRPKGRHIKSAPDKGRDREEKNPGKS